MKVTDIKSTKNTLENSAQAVHQKKVSCLKTHLLKKGKVSGDRVNLSQKACDIKKISDIIQKTPDVREEKVAHLKEEIASGNYQVSGRDIADKMLEEFILEEI
jgi:negative regulator of flagellin synthesis FlgM